jgi:hypothetical protein
VIANNYLLFNYRAYANPRVGANAYFACQMGAGADVNPVFYQTIVIDCSTRIDDDTAAKPRFSIHGSLWKNDGPCPNDCRWADVRLCMHERRD